MSLDPNQLASLLGIAPADKQAAVKAKVDQLMSLASGHFQVPLVAPDIYYDLKGHVAGRANGKMIRVNLDLLLGDHYNDMLT